MKLVALLTLVCFTSATAQAAVFERDWKTPGDGLLTYDDVNQREWLDLSASLLSQFSGTLEDRYQSAMAETMLGGEFESFTAARSIDVIALAESAGIDTTTLDYPTNIASTQNMLALFGVTLTLGNVQYAVGLLDEISTNPSFPNRRVMSVFQLDFDDQLAGLSTLFVGSLDMVGGSNSTGIMLYRVVPEPSCMAIVFAALFMVSRSRSVIHI